MNNHTRLTLTRPTGTTFFTYKRSINLPRGWGKRGVGGGWGGWGANTALVIWAMLAST